MENLFHAYWWLIFPVLGMLVPYLAEGFAHIAPQQGLMVTAILITLPTFILLFRKGLKL